jgi:hypothetical protein
VTLPTDYVGSDDTEDVDHAGMHNDVNAAVNAVNAELGANPSGASPTVAARLDSLDTTVAGKEAAGTAATAVAAHAAASDPHGDRAYADAALATKADLVGGVLPTSQLPALAVTEHLGSVANQSAMLALSGQKGDWCIRSDVGQVYVITGADPSLLASWTALAYPTSPVSSVNGETGVVVLSPGDVGADPAGTAASLVDDLSGVTDAATARTNLGLGSAAVLSTSDIDERARDAVGSALVAGTGMTVTPNDGADTITVATSAILPTVVDAKGDLLVGTAADTVGRLAVGTNGHVLTADSAEASGVKWAAPSAGGSLDVRDEGTSLTSAATRLNFVGRGVSLAEPVVDQIEVQVDTPNGLPSVGNSLWPLHVAGSDLSTVNGDMYCVKIVVPRSASFDQYTAHVSAGSAGATLRFALYQDSAGPARLVAGSEVSGVSATSGGVKFGTMGAAVTLSAGIYWIAIAPQGGAPTLTAFGAPVNGTQDPGLTGFVISAALHFKHASAQTGAFPSSFGFSYTNPLTAPRVALNRSA